MNADRILQDANGITEQMRAIRAPTKRVVRLTYKQPATVDLQAIADRTLAGKARRAPVKRSAMAEFADRTIAR